ncbi:uncharacterized protein [Triticum aestivum]|uniref:uncharacterized protein n=1 Tax=Triticum aestivum TaxID=4565 RepID=UPI001D01E117|nr:uncharacterized protein LOC123083822 [Triticum aestivum]
MGGRAAVAAQWVGAVAEQQVEGSGDWGLGSAGEEAPLGGKGIEGGNLTLKSRDLFPSASALTPTSGFILIQSVRVSPIQILSISPHQPEASPRSSPPLPSCPFWIGARADELRSPSRFSPPPCLARCLICIASQASCKRPRAASLARAPQELDPERVELAVPVSDEQQQLPQLRLAMPLLLRRPAPFVSVSARSDEAPAFLPSSVALPATKLPEH